MNATEHEGLRIRGLNAGYGGGDVLHGIDLDVPPGRVVTLIGANGAGKSTLLACICGLVKPRSGEIGLGDVRLDAPHAHPSRLGVALVPEGRRVFARRTVADNLMIGAWVRRHDRRGVAADREEMYERFPILGERRAQPSGALSGGEAQMLAIAMALMSRPRVLLLDEPSLGLAPLVVDQVLEVAASLAADGMSVLLVESIVQKALAVAHYGYVLELGRITGSGTAAELSANADIAAAYLGKTPTPPPPAAEI